MIKGELYYTSDRLNKLFETVGNLFKSNDKAKLIIFIANRIVAHILNPTLSKFLKEKFPNKKCNEIIGVNYKKTKSSLELTPTITLSKLNKIVKDFNDDNFDILIGTSAIEEGLDIQSCNAVISLAEIQTPKSYIQMKGRARKTDSLFYIFSYSIEETKGKVRDFLEIRKSMKELFNNDIKKDFRRMNYIKEKKDFIFRFNPKTHSKLTTGNVSIFFNEIRQQIESCGYKFSPKIYVADIKNTTPQKFIGKIDVITDLKWKVKESYKTNLCNSKDDATKMCYLWVLISLIEQKYLDDHLKFCKDKLKKNK
jgi:endoribonuclease Dicer